ncbi:NACHT domain-containing protein [Pseudonocardia humida]|uniref:NACHT domain-containing protein n=1 Tax=Pseudonocardia humida TaxID=2800819 RepID=A0ABT1A836_9PSEU|nr:NACHT domain-containing protein [Pseudonocardia humida]MCO1659191.1 NACHT domain-containing protein [Pseudonocardia humida]
MRVGMRSYSRLVLNNVENVYMPVPGKGGVTLKVEDMFVNLKLENFTRNTPTVSDTALLTLGNRIQVIGDPGSGKSTLIKKLLIDSCRQAIERPRSSKLAVRIELKNLRFDEAGEDLGEQFIGKVRAVVAQQIGQEANEAVDLFLRCSEDAGLLVLLDGLDEVASQEYPTMTKAIESLSSRLARLSEKNIVVLTMRVQFYQQVYRDLTSSFPVVLHIQRFTSNDIFKFLSSWFRGQSDAGVHVNKVFGELSDKPSLRDLCTNPLILSMYVVNFQRASSIDLPDTRTSFYSDVSSEFLIMRRARQWSLRSARVARIEQREGIFGSIALENLSDITQPANQLSWSTATQIVKAELNLDTDVAAEENLLSLSSETGLITPERDMETFRFIHLTICEYFAALEAIRGREDGWDNLIHLHGSFQRDPSTASRLIEVLPFACALARRDQRRVALVNVAALGDNELLGRCLLETQAYDHWTWERYRDRERAHLVTTPVHSWDERWFSRLHLYQVVVADASDVLGVDESSSLDSVFDQLISNNRERLLLLFRSYAEHNAPSALRLSRAYGMDLLAEAPDIIVDACDEPPFLELVVDHAQQEPDRQRIHRWAAVLTEAILRSRTASERLAKAQITDAWSTEFDTSRTADSAWPMNRVVHPNARNSLLVGAVSIATSDLALSTPPTLHLLTALHSLPNPNRQSSQISRRVLPLLLVSGILLSAGAWETFNDPASRLGIVLSLLGFPPYVYAFMLFAARMRMWRLYGAVVNRGRPQVKTRRSRAKSVEIPPLTDLDAGDKIFLWFANRKFIPAMRAYGMVAAGVRTDRSQDAN